MENYRFRLQMFLVGFVIIMLMGTLGFMSIEKLSAADAFYFSIVTIATVGYGDITPQTVWGQAVAAFAMVLGYSLIIIPTGIFAGELIKVHHQHSDRACPECGNGGHAQDAVFCKHCGDPLNKSP